MEAAKRQNFAAPKLERSFRRGSTGCTTVKTGECFQTGCVKSYLRFQVSIARVAQSAANFPAGHRQQQSDGGRGQKQKAGIKQCQPDNRLPR